MSNWSIAHEGMPPSWPIESHFAIFRQYPSLLENSSCPPDYIKNKSLDVRSSLYRIVFVRIHCQVEQLVVETKQEILTQLGVENIKMGQDKTVSGVSLSTKSTMPTLLYHPNPQPQ